MYNITEKTKSFFIHFLQKKKWFLIITISLLVSILFLNFVNIYVLENTYKDYISGTITELFGILVTILFVQYLFDISKKSESRKKESELIKRSDMVLQIYVDRYMVLFYCLTTPIGKRIIDNGYKINNNFTFSDMKDMYKTSLLDTYCTFGMVINNFIESELDIREQFLFTLRTIQFTHFIEIRETIEIFIKNSLQMEVKKIIDERILTKYGDKRAIDEDTKSLVDGTVEERYKAIVSGTQKIGGNTMDVYIRLYVLMQTGLSTLEKYKKQIEDIA